MNRLENFHIIFISKLHLLVMAFLFHQLSPSLKERQGVLPLASVKPTPFSGHFPGCHHLTFPEKSTEMTAHNATCLPHIGVGIFRKVADAKFEVPLNTASPIPRKYKNNDKFKGMMWSCTWVLETHVTSMTISEVVSVAVLSNLPQTTSNVTIVKPRTNCSCIYTCVYSYTHVLVKCIDPTYFY